jgi:hypothetical protein
VLGDLTDAGMKFTNPLRSAGSGCRSRSDERAVEDSIIGRRVIALPAFLVFRVLVVAVSAAGFAALAAGMAVRTLAANATVPLITSLPSFAFTLGGALLLSSITASVVMPARTALVRHVRGEVDPPLPAQVMALLVLLCGVAMLQMPGVLSWWRAEQAILAAVLPEHTDPSGFEYIPMDTGLRAAGTGGR